MDKFFKKELTKRELLEKTLAMVGRFGVGWVGLKGKLLVFLKPRIIVNQNVSELCMKVERNNEKKT